MNYPVWEVAFGAGLLIATVAIIRVFVSHFAVGAWFLMALPRPISSLVMGGYLLANILLVIGVGSGLAAIILMSKALRNQNIRLAGYSSLGIMSVVILSMIGIREMVLLAYLKPYFHPEHFAVKTQWLVFPLFLVLFIAGVILWFVMLKRYSLFDNWKLPERFRL